MDKTEELLNDWVNVMEQDFQDPKFNSYLETQPGSNVLHDEGLVSRVHISGIPESYSLEAMRNLCKDFGTVVSVSKPANYKKYIFVEYSDPAEAQRCIEEINCKFKRMRANFAKPKQPQVVIPCPMPTSKPPEIPNSIMLNKRKWTGPIVRPSIVDFGIKNIPLALDEYKLCEKLDPHKMFYNEAALCDLLDPELDLPEIQSEITDFKWCKGLWIYKKDIVAEEIAANNNKSNTITHGKQQVLAKACKTCGRRSLRGKENNTFCSQKCQENCDTVIRSSLEFVEINDKVPIVVTAVLHQNLIYVRPADSLSNAKYQKGLQEIFEACQDSKIVKNIAVGDIVAVKVGRAFYRALVLKDLQTQFRIALIDTGAVSIQLPENLFEIPDKVKFLPVMISKVILKGVPNFYLHLPMVNFLNSILLGQWKFVLRVQWQDNFKAEIMCNDESLNRKLIEKIEILEPDWDTAPPEDEDLPNIDINVKNEKFIVVDNTLLGEGMVSIVLEKHLDRLRYIHEKINAYGRSIKMEAYYTPKVGEICLLRSSDTFFRAICAEIVGDQHPSIFIIDFGLRSIANIKDLAPLPRALLEPFAVTQVCNIKDFNEFGTMENLQKAQAECKIMTIFMAEKISYNKEDERYLIESKELLEKLESFSFFYSNGETERNNEELTL